MIARVAVWEPMPDDDRQWVIDAAKTVPGVLDAYHLAGATDHLPSAHDGRGSSSQPISSAFVEMAPPSLRRCPRGPRRRRWTCPPLQSLSSLSRHLMHS